MTSNYNVQFSKEALRYFSKLDRKKKEKLASVIDALKENPFLLPNVKPLQGLPYDMYLVRVGDLRIIYRLENEKLLILILKIGSRGDIYK
ncbi:MAG: type II toxin-antitoxin system RelE/ParE family toxin [Bacillaceae bacterium]|nr:type II toxin-antitoxin system RelE/ParE family toxin [Bacillaceae bacterium]